MAPVFLNALGDRLVPLNPAMLGLAFLICACGCRAVLGCFRQAQRASGWRGWFWLVVLSASLGAIAWMTQFLILRAYMSPASAAHGAERSLGATLLAVFALALPLAALLLRAEARNSGLQPHEADMLRFQARHDEATGLPNRLLLRESLAAAIRTAGDRPSFAVLRVELHRFKLVNEIYGRETGDGLLIQVAARMQDMLGAEDIVARIGGDKFVILHHSNALPADALALADRLIQCLEEPFFVEGHDVRIGGSIGIAINPSESSSTEALLLDAETALRHGGMEGGQSCLFEPRMRLEQEARRALEHDFRRAIESRQFVLHYQPLFESDDLALSGFEALVRWQHPTRGMVSPSEFIPFAEKSGLINKLGLWVLETACAAAAEWPEHLRISINISPVQLRSSDLVGAVSGILEKTGLQARRLDLEVTEGALIENPAQARSILSRLRDMGVQITIDDFGTGYSSLSYLRHFPFDRIKIDRSFLEHLQEDSDPLLIVRAIIDLGHSLRVGVLAEGVETAEQLQLLRLQNCDQFQGFLLGRPVPANSAAALAKAHSRSAARPFAPASPAQDLAERTSPAFSG